LILQKRKIIAENCGEFEDLEDNPGKDRGMTGHYCTTLQVLLGRIIGKDSPL
jgi:hypothetical protein